MCECVVGHHVQVSLTPPASPFGSLPSCLPDHDNLSWLLCSAEELQPVFRCRLNAKHVRVSAMQHLRRRFSESEGSWIWTTGSCAAKSGVSLRLVGVRNVLMKDHPPPIPHADFDCVTLSQRAISEKRRLIGELPLARVVSLHSQLLCALLCGVMQLC